MRKIITMFAALIATTALWASNVITYTATEKLPETTSTYSGYGLHVNAFNVAITNHSFSNGQGTITFEGEVTTIGNYAFYRCDSLKSITIPSGVTSIGSSAFSNCTSLSSVTIPNSVNSIENYAFGYCSSLKTITIPSGVTNIKSGTFNSCKSLENISIPPSVTSIEDYAFFYCAAIQNITIPSSVRKIGEFVFCGCLNLTTISVDSSNTHYVSIDGVLFNYAKDTLIQYPNGNTRDTYSFPNSVTCIGVGAFAFGYTPRNLAIPFGVTSIGKGAFSECKFLQTITFPSSVTSIRTGTFSFCTSLKSVTIPNSVDSIGEGAFDSCSSLGSVTCYATMPPICGSGCFYDVNKSIPLYVLANSITTYQAADEWKDFTNILPIGAEPATTTEVVVTPYDNSVTITWPTTDGADSYTIVINKGGAPFCTLTFNAQGQLTNIAFAPGRGGSNDVTMAEAVTGGYKFTITSLTPATKYNYEIDTKNASGTSLANYSGEFTTKNPTALNQLTDSEFKIQNSKFIRNGQLLILRDNKTYNAQGSEVR